MSNTGIERRESWRVETEGARMGRWLRLVVVMEGMTRLFSERESVESKA